MIAFFFFFFRDFKKFRRFAKLLAYPSFFKRIKPETFFFSLRRKRLWFSPFSWKIFSEVETWDVSCRRTKCFSRYQFIFLCLKALSIKVHRSYQGFYINPLSCSAIFQITSRDGFQSSIYDFALALNVKKKTWFIMITLLKLEIIISF